jgi:O-succinylbenzoic acid--CoA ligase
VVVIKFDFASDGLNESLLSLKSNNQDWAKPYLQFLNQYIKGDSIEVKSSGSTGTPKTLVFTSEQYNASANKSINYFGFKESQTVASALPGNTVGGQLMFIRAYLSKMVLYLFPPKLNAFDELSEKIDFAPMVGSQFQALIDNNRTQNFKQILLGGGPLIPNQLKALSNLDCEVFASYGMTETLSHVALRNLTNKEDYYTILPGNKASINQEGCITLSCDYLPTDVITTDFGEIIDNKIHVLGRADFTIISSGKKIQPEVIEAKLQSFLSTKYLVVGKEDETFGNIIGLLIASKINPEEEKKLQEYNATTPSHEKIRFVEVSTFFETEQKILRRKTITHWENSKA